MKKILIIQTAFIGDVILATPLIEKLHQSYLEISIDFMLRKGNEGLLDGHPFINQLLIWDKKQKKYSQLIRLIKTIRQQHYDYVINLQRFFSTGIITAFSGANNTIGFRKNPMSLFFTLRYAHLFDLKIGKIHEVDRNLTLITSITDIDTRVLPKLYPTEIDFSKVKVEGQYITISPTSVWFTKEYPSQKWIDMINLCEPGLKIFLLGGKTDFEACQNIKTQCTHSSVMVMAGRLSFLESAALMKNAVMNYVNDSAPMHLASAMNAPVTAIFCSTIPGFGFGPLSTDSRIIETSENLACRPCGLHGFKKCPEDHFKCADIPASAILYSNK